MFKQPPLKRKILLVLGILIILSCFIGLSYALWIFTDSQRDENIVNLDCFEIHFSEANVLNLQNSFPLRDSDGEALQPYHFKIENKCSSYAKYVLTIENKCSSYAKYVLTIETNQSSTLDTKYLKVKTNENTPVIMNNLNPGEVKKEANKEAYVIDTGYLDKLESKDYDVRIWLDEKVTTDDMNSNGSTVENSSWNGFVNLSVAYSNKIERSAFLAGMEVPVVEEGTGLYKVDHSEYEGETAGFSQTEYRYAGLDPDNYVDFNNEKWRIIGLVNVLTTDGNVEQRLKIIKADVYTSDAWNSTSIRENDWTKASLMKLLNGDYLMGIGPTFQNMIATDIRWNLGGFNSFSRNITSQFYQYERGTTVYQGNQTYWDGQVALMYPSDYGYATSGGSTYNRSTCLGYTLWYWNENGYQADCAGNDWLYSSNGQWTLMHNSTIYYGVFGINSTGSIYGNSAGESYVVRPIVYLKPDVKIVDGKGTIKDSFQLVNNSSHSTVKLTDFIKDTVSKVSEGPGLYEVDHDGVQITDEEEHPVSGWDTEELRYAGSSEQVNNYVKFNDELWRIIGLVNVQTTSGTITQRLKIIKADVYTSAAWYYSATPYGKNNWIESSLQTTLNGTYLNNMPNKNMVATDIRWNLGGYSSYSEVITNQYYQYERGTTVYVYDERPTYWDGQVGLMYPSDYGYASSGGSKYNKSQCLAKDMSAWSDTGYKTDCAWNDWLYDSSNDQWTLMPDSDRGTFVFCLLDTGHIHSMESAASLAIRPVVYLKPDVLVTNPEAMGSDTDPYELELPA